jgi:chromosomal replication initiation ATPase DnaA
MISLQRTYARASDNFVPTPIPPRRKLFDIAAQCCEPKPLPKPTVAHIKSRTEAFYKLSPGTTSRRSRKRKIVYPRQVAMYLARIMTRKSYPTIGQVFGGYDHSTVIHAVRSIEKRIEADADFAADIEVLREGLAQ